MLNYPPHLKCDAALPWKTNNHILHFSCTQNMFQIWLYYLSSRYGICQMSWK